MSGRISAPLHLETSEQTPLKKDLDKDRYIVAAIVADVLWIGYLKVLLSPDDELVMLRVLSEYQKQLKEVRLEFVLDKNLDSV